MADDNLVDNPPVTPPTPESQVATPPPTPAPSPSQTLSNDADELKAIGERIEGSITEKVEKSVFDRIGKALGLTKEEEEQLPTDPKELAKFVREESKKGVQEIFSEQERAEQQRLADHDKQTSEGAQKYQQLWAGQYNELASRGMVPPITNPADPNDIGNRAKVIILTKLYQVLKDNEANGVDYVPTIKEIFYENPNIFRTETTAGANVPVSGGGRVTAPNNGLTYEQMHKSDIDDLVKAKYGI